MQQVAIARRRPRVVPLAARRPGRAGWVRHLPFLVAVVIGPLAAAAWPDQPSAVEAPGLAAVAAPAALPPLEAITSEEIILPQVLDTPVAVVLESLEPVRPLTVGTGYTRLPADDLAAATNVEIAIAFLDGHVIEPGARFSFDDVARSWDFREDPQYVLGRATSARGMILMPGGGVCRLSSAIWEAALLAGLATERRVLHSGLLEGLYAGLDATNTLVIRNDSQAPITVRARLEDGVVYADLLAEGPLDRTATIWGPERTGARTYVMYQDVTWADGRTTSAEFVSRYLW